MTPLFEAHIVDKRHGARQVLRDAHVQLYAGEIVSLVGGSGCGKSTLLSIAAGLDQAYRGQVLLAGVAQAGVQRDIGVIFQEPRLFPWLTVGQNIAFGQGAGAGNGAAVERLLQEVGLEGYADALPKQLSGGQAQRVAIARGLFMRPRVLLLDEPFSAVDAFTRMKLQDLLLRVTREHALTLLLVTHDIDEALYLSDRVLLLDVAAGPVAAEFAVPLARPRLRGDLAQAPLKAAILQRLEAAHAI
ncbi:ABC transporter ATP-binding protein [Massilia violaceinigra]|uniref:ABC transporter ATP-binding protein n=1 Tax=Massilia violaceinigra TaxID=2045208 RepID=A0ABY4AD93_9BURK|nr:ABC transporter ATP-binding protein [Massilia violaceinigra]UOD32766.1 ABC transporter ATP-binding protein [Massilia violaceinigra]